MPLTFGCILTETMWGPSAGPQALRIEAQFAESLGFDSVWVPDHIVIPRKVDAAYPYTADGRSPFDPDQPYLETLSVLNYLAACTQQIRIGTYVLIIPYRHPVLTAKILATVDVLSEGRLILGAGVGWMEEEFEVLGLSTFEKRGAVTNEYLRLFKELWTQDEPEFHGEYYSVTNVGFFPKPVQTPHPPIWVGGHTEPALRRAARLGDGWLPLALREPTPLLPEEYAKKLERLRDLTREAARPEDAVAPCVSLPLNFGDANEFMSGGSAKIAADLKQYQKLGVNNFVLTFQSDNAAGKRESMERFAREVRPILDDD